jgi:hypothetical protein
MGVGHSQEPDELISRRRSPVAQQGIPSRSNRRRAFFRKVRTTPTTHTVVPTRHQSTHRRRYGEHRMHAHIPVSRQPQGIMPPFYNPHIGYGRLPEQQPMMMPVQSMAGYQPMMMPPPAMLSQPMMMMPQQIALSMGQSQWTRYLQQQSTLPPPPSSIPPPMQPVYSYIPLPSPIQPGSTAIPMRPYRAYYSTANRNLTTDWTGGGMISPGFLGPPL